MHRRIDLPAVIGVQNIDVKSVQIKIKNVKKRKKSKRDKKLKKTFVNVMKKRYLFLVFLALFNSTPDAQEMAFKATRNMPFSLVSQKLSSF